MLCSCCSLDALFTVAVIAIALAVHHCHCPFHRFPYHHCPYGHCPCPCFAITIVINALILSLAVAIAIIALSLSLAIAVIALAIATDCLLPLQTFVIYPVASLL